MEGRHDTGFRTSMVLVSNGSHGVECPRVDVGVLWDFAHDTQALRVEPTVSDEALRLLADFVRSGTVDVLNPQIKELYQLSAQLRFTRLRDAVENQLADALRGESIPEGKSDESTPSVGVTEQGPTLGAVDAMTDQVYSSGSWRGLYASGYVPETVMLSSFLACPDIPSARFGVRQLLGDASSLPNPFGISSGSC